MTIEILVTGAVAIAATGFGWFLNQISSAISLKREDKVAIGKLLVSLAEIRYQLTTTNLYFERAAKRMPFTHDDATKARHIMGKLLPQLDQFGERYDDAVLHLAGRSPDLAFRLHSKGRLPSALSEWRRIVGQDPIAAYHADKMEVCLNKHVLPHLDETILELARTHCPATKAKFVKRVKQWNDKVFMESEIDKLLDDLIGCIGKG